MLRQLTIRNFALIDNLCLELEPGFNVLTGETGAGKSIIVDAIGILTGNRASIEFIREGQDKATIEGFFELDSSDLIQKISEMGFLLEDDCLSLSREITRNGKNSCRINGRLVPLSLYQQIGRELVDIHSQNQEQSLLSPAKQMDLLDSFGGLEIAQQKAIVAEKYALLLKLNKELKDLGEDDSDKEMKREILSYQIEEISNAQLKPQEEEELIQIRKVLANAEKLAGGTEQIFNLLFAGGREGLSAYDLISKALVELEQLTDFEPKFQAIKEGLESLNYQLEDYAFEVKKYNENIDFEPGKLENIERRLDTINQLKRKYGGSIKDILEHLEELRQQMELLEKRSELFQKLQEQLAAAEEDYRNECLSLRRLRLKTAKVLEEKISNAMEDLDFLNSTFKIELSDADKPQANGLDQVEFLFSPNPGEGLKPLNKIASGGEISRVMLAFKSVLAEIDAIPTLIFDEIDTGVGGKAVLALGQKLANIAVHRQVISITHSPQVASFGDNHFFIYKEVVDNRTITRIKKLTHEDRITELARMMGGSEHSDVVLKHAQDMLDFALQEKCV